MNIDIILSSLIPNLNVDLLEYWKDRACLEISTYLNKDIEKEIILEKYSQAVVELVVEYNQKLKVGEGITSVTQGQRSITYETSSSTMSNKVKKLLPKPFIKVGVYSVL